MSNAIIEYRTTYYMHSAHPGAFKSTTASFIKMHQAGMPLNKIKVFPGDVVTAWFTDEDKEVLRRFYPAKLALYKYIWDNVGDTDKATLRKHLKRCVDVREQFKKGLCSEDVRIWYMALVLGGADV